MSFGTSSGSGSSFGSESSPDRQKSDGRIIGIGGETKGVYSSITPGSSFPQDTSKDGKLPSFTPSEEFRAFWGNELDPTWFSTKRSVSPFLIVLLLLTFLTFYLCSDLLFTPSEIFDLFDSSGGL